MSCTVLGLFSVWDLGGFSRGLGCIYRVWDLGVKVKVLAGLRV